MKTCKGTRYAVKQAWELSARTLAIVLVGWLLTTNLLVCLSYFGGWWPCKVALFLCLAFLPGVAVLRFLRITPRGAPTGIVFCFGLSILVLMLSGLVANQV